MSHPTLLQLQCEQKAVDEIRFNTPVDESQLVSCTTNIMKGQSWYGLPKKIKTLWRVMVHGLEEPTTVSIESGKIRLNPVPKEHGGVITIDYIEGSSKFCPSGKEKFFDEST